MIPLIDLSRFHRAIREEVVAAMARVYDSGQFILGPEVEGFERELGHWLGGTQTVGVSSGTDAITCALLALGVGPTSKVLTVPFSFMGTVSGIAATGAQVDFVDLAPEGFGVDPEALNEQLHKIRPQAAVLVDLFGRVEVPESVRNVARELGCALVEDAAQALGGQDPRGRAGCVADIGCFSFFPSKPLGALGDGGAVVTQDRQLAESVRRVRVHGSAGKYEHLQRGGNFRLDALQAAVLRVKLRHLERRIAACRAHAACYRAAWSELPGLILPDDDESCFSLYTLRVPLKREGLRTFLHGRGINSAVHYPRALHQQPALAAMGYGPGSFPNAERRAAEVLSVPLFPELTVAERNAVVTAVRAFFAS